MNDIPCKDCITLAACRGLVTSCDMQDKISVMKTIATLSAKCNLLKPHIFTKTYSTFGDGETMEFDTFNDQGIQDVFNTILENEDRK